MLPNESEQRRRWLEEFEHNAPSQRRAHYLTIIEGIAGIAGMLILGWSPLPMLLFVMTSLSLTLIQLLGEWVLRRDALECALSEYSDVEQARAALHSTEPLGESSAASSPAIKGPAWLSSYGAQASVALLIAMSFAASVIFEFARTTELSITALLLGRPDMAISMLCLLILRLYTLFRGAQGSKQAITWLNVGNPILESLLFMALIFMWMVVSAIGLELQAVHGGERQIISASIFVIFSYLISIWRARGELKGMKELGGDLRQLAAS